MRKQAKIILVHAIGWVLIVAGFSAFLVPIIPGFILVIIGIYFISLESVWVKTRLDRFLSRHPHLEGPFRRFEKWKSGAINRMKGVFKNNQSHKL